MHSKDVVLNIHVVYIAHGVIVKQKQQTVRNPTFSIFIPAIIKSRELVPVQSGRLHRVGIGDQAVNSLQNYFTGYFTLSLLTGFISCIYTSMCYFCTCSNLIIMSYCQDEYIQSRASAMENIESTIVELGSIFQELAHMVKEQEEQIERFGNYTCR